MPAHGAGKNDPLQIPSAGDEILHLVAVGDARNVLLDDRAVVEQIGYIVTGRARTTRSILFSARISSCRASASVLVAAVTSTNSNGIP